MFNLLLEVFVSYCLSLLYTQNTKNIICITVSPQNNLVQVMTYRSCVDVLLHRTDVDEGLFDMYPDRFYGISCPWARYQRELFAPC